MTSHLNIVAAFGFLMLCCAFDAFAAPVTLENERWNVNRNYVAKSPSQYYGEWPKHQYFPSPDDWRDHPVYHLVTDRFRDGDPQNNNGAFGGYNPRDINFRHGGDFVGLREKLDYIKSLGYTALWISPIFQNLFNEYHGYGQIDFTLIDDRLGTLEEFRQLVTAAHERGMYVIVDVVVNHLSGLLYPEGYQRARAPFRMHDGEYRMLERTPGTRYADFSVVNKFIPTGTYPDLYVADYYPLRDLDGEGSYWDSDFHHNGDLADYKNGWELQLGRIYGRYDDLRLEHPRVQEKITAMTKALIASTDIDGIRVDTPMQVPLPFLKTWVPAVRAYAKSLGKMNFFIFGETYTRRDGAALMIGRGRTPAMFGADAVLDDRVVFDGGIHYGFYKKFIDAAILRPTPSSANDLIELYARDRQSYDMRPEGSNAPIYRMLNFFGSHDQRRIASYPDGLRKLDLASKMTAFWPGVPILYYGDEQAFSSYGVGLDGHGREDLMTSVAWRNHPAAASPNPASADNFDMCSATYRALRDVMNVRRSYPALRRGDEITPLWSDSRAAAVLRRDTVSGTWAIVMFNVAAEVTHVPSIDVRAALSSGTVVNPFYPAEVHAVAVGKIKGFALAPFEAKVLVPKSELKPSDLTIRKVTPNHDSIVPSGEVAVTVLFDRAVDRRSLTGAILYDDEVVAMSSLDVQVDRVVFPVKAAPGIHHLTITSSARGSDGAALFAEFSSRFRTGSQDSVLVNVAAEDSPQLINQGEVSSPRNEVTLYHRAEGAKWFRVSSDGGANFSNWEPYKGQSPWVFRTGPGWRELLVQYWADGSGAYYVRDGIDIASSDGVGAEQF